MTTAISIDYDGGSSNGSAAVRLRDAEKRLKEYEEQWKQISDGACQIGWIVSETDKHYLLHLGSALMAVNKPAFRLLPGDAVRVVAQTMQVVDKIETPHLGPAVRVASLLDDKHCEVELGSGRMVVLKGRCIPDEGDRVMLDPSGRVCMRVLPMDKATPVAASVVTWAEVGGHARAKAELIDAVETPYKNPGVYERYGQRPLKGVLLHGPSGCGKSLLGKAVAAAVSEPHGGKGRDTAFIYVKGPELIEKWVGSSEANVRGLFDSARQHKKKHGYPAVIFIDEAEAVLGHRGGGMHLSSGGTMSQTVVPAFLAEMDGLEDSAAFVLLATNLPTSLDSAVVRDGRIDRKIHVGRPDQDTAREIFELHLRARPGSRKELARAGAEALYDAGRVLFHLEMRDDSRTAVTLRDVASGAMIEGIVGRATQSAIRRELSSGERGKLTAEDVVAAVAEVQAEVALLDHSAALEEAGHDLSRVRAIRRSTRSS